MCEKNKTKQKIPHCLKGTNESLNKGKHLRTRNVWQERSTKKFTNISTRTVLKEQASAQTKNKHKKPNVRQEQSTKKRT